MIAIWALEVSSLSKSEVSAMGVMPTLFPDAAERRRLDVVVTEALMAARARSGRGSVVPDFDPTAFRCALEDFDFTAPRSIEAVIGWILSQLEHGIVQITHPCYFGLFNPQPCFPAQLADRIAGAFNPQLASATTAPVPVAIEAHMIKAVAARAGLRGIVAGHFTSGGSEANRTSLVCSLTASNPNFAEHGARAFSGQPVFYVSREAHVAWIKISHEVGIGRAAARLVPTDTAGRLLPAALVNMLEADRAEGAIPVMLVATAGTTGGGMLDPLVELADVAADQNVWYHVDAAWAGAAVASPRLKPLLAGIERARSITIDAHKWFATTMGCGMFLTTDPATLSASFRVSTTFMPSEAANLDPYLNSAQWSRRFLGLRLFLALANVGWEGFAAHIERSASLAQELASALQAHGWCVLNDPSFAVVCAVPPPKSADPKTIAARVLASGKAWISTTNFAGQTVVRACITNGETTATDIALLVAALEAARGTGLG